jgi:hypothetical protein
MASGMTGFRNLPQLVVELARYFDWGVNKLASYGNRLY